MKLTAALTLGFMLLALRAGAQTAPATGPVLGGRDEARGRKPGDRTVAEGGKGLVERDTVQVAPGHGLAVKKVVVDNRLGDVEVVGHDAPEVAITVIKRAPDGTTLDRLKVNLITDPDGTVDIGAALATSAEARPVPAREIRIDVSVRVPRGAAVEVRAWNGRVAVTGVRNGATLSANAADVTVADVTGPVTTGVTRGTQHLTGLHGAVKADATYGQLDIEGVSGTELAARVHEGQLNATRVRSRKVRLRTTLGDIHFSGELMAGADVDIASYQGTVEVELVPSRAAVRVDLASRDGAIDSRLDLARGQTGADHVFGMLGRGKRAATLHVSSVHGDLSVGMAGIR
jgi:hypothetical protein